MMADPIEIVRLRTELAFIYGDTRHGGPQHEEERWTILAEIHRLEELQKYDEAMSHVLDSKRS